MRHGGFVVSAAVDEGDTGATAGCLDTSVDRPTYAEAADPRRGYGRAESIDERRRRRHRADWPTDRLAACMYMSRRPPVARVRISEGPPLRSVIPVNF